MLRPELRFFVKAIPPDKAPRKPELRNLKDITPNMVASVLQSDQDLTQPAGQGLEVIGIAFGCETLE